MSLVIEGKSSRTSDLVRVGTMPEQRGSIDVYRPPWQLTYAELCRQPIVLFRGMRTLAKPGDYGLNWSPFPSVAITSFSGGRHIYILQTDPTTLRIFLEQSSKGPLFRLTGFPQGVRELTREEIEYYSDRERKFVNRKPRILEEHLYPVENKVLPDGKRVVLHSLTLWVHGIELAMRNGEHVPSDVFEQYEADHNQFEIQ